MGGSWMTSGEWSGHLFLCFGCVSVTSVYGVSLSGETSSWYKTLANTKISNTEISGLVPGYFFCNCVCKPSGWVPSMSAIVTDSCDCYHALTVVLRGGLDTMDGLLINLFKSEISKSERFSRSIFSHFCVKNVVQRLVCMLDWLDAWSNDSGVLKLLILI